MPAAANASLWIGAVTSAAAAPARTRATACSMQRAAAAPARASTTPSGASIRSAGRPSACSTGMQPRRQRRRVGGALDPRHGQQAAGEPGGAPHHGDVADDEGAARLGGGRAEPGGDDLRADAAGVAHRQGERPGARVKPCAIVGATRRDNADHTSTTTMRKAWLLFSQTVTDRGRPAVRRRDAQARLAQARSRSGGRRRRAGRAAAGAGAERLADRHRHGDDELRRRRQARLAGGGQHHRQPRRARGRATTTRCSASSSATAPARRRRSARSASARA